MSLNMKLAGIYQIKNLVNGKIYIGLTKEFAGRFVIHLCQLRGNKHYNRKLQSAWNKYG